MAQPVTKLPTAESFGLTEAKEKRLSQIIAEINSRTGKAYDIDDALIEGLSQNPDFFSLLLSNDEIKRQVLGIFTDEIYKSLREA